MILQHWVFQLWRFCMELSKFISPSRNERSLNIGNEFLKKCGVNEHEGFEVTLTVVISSLSISPCGKKNFWWGLKKGVNLSFWKAYRISRSVHYVIARNNTNNKSQSIKTATSESKHWQQTREQCYLSEIATFGDTNFSYFYTNNWKTGRGKSLLGKINWQK